VTDRVLAIIYICIICVPVCKISLLFQEEQYQAYRASLVEMTAEVKKIIIKLHKLKK
jgi:hypothetical protein